MDIDLSGKLDSIKDGIKETADIAHVKTSEFHEKYISKITPDCGKYGDVVTFAAEMIPGVSEYNAIKDGDWQAFAIAAGVDIASIAVGALTAGAGYAAVKGGTAAAKTGVKVAAKEVAEAGAKKVVKEVAETGAEKAVKEVAEAGAEKVVKEVAEEGVEKAVKETAEAGVEKAVKETVDVGVEKTARETVEKAATKDVKEAGKKIDEKIEIKQNNVESPEHIKCLNENLAGKNHPETGVPFEQKQIEVDGKRYDAVVPKFDSAFDAQLPDNLLKETDYKQFQKCNEQLKNEISVNDKLKSKFDVEQLEQINHGDTPDGYVWHHDAEVGKMQLVDLETHQKTNHTGGRHIWGGGTANR